MIKKEKNSSNYCKYCGWEFQDDIVQKINENTEPVYCEFCGIEINITSISRREEHNKEKYERISNSKDNIEKNKKSIVKSISKITKSRKHSVDVIFEDDDFPKIFKGNLIIVVSRLIYFFIREWEQDNNVSVCRVSLTKSILYELANKVKPIIDKRISRKLLKNLHELTIEEFEDWLKLFQKKLDSEQEYRTHFKTYLLWLVKIVFKLVSDMWNMNNLPKFESKILNDLKNYHFNITSYRKEDYRDITPKKYNRKIINKEKIRNFPVKTRLILCKYILETLNHKNPPSKIINNIIMNFENEKITDDWIKKIPELELLDLRNKLKSFEFKIALDTYLQDLVKIMLRLTKMNFQTQESLNIKEFAATLVKDKINLGMKLDSLRHQLRIIIDYLNNEVKDFELLRKIKQILYDDGEKKECARCHNIKPYEGFVKRKGGKVESLCSKCKLEVSATRMFKNKLKLISEIYGGRFNSKCVECESDISILPVLEFHHPNRHLKKISWSKYRYVNFNDIIKKLEDDKVLLLCANCHSQHQSSVYNNYKEIILKKNLFQNSAEKIYELVSKFVNKVDKDKNGDQRSKIKYIVIIWIKKRYVIEQLYQGKCVGCGKISVINNLPALDFHHKNFRPKKGEDSIWRRVQTKEIDTIVKRLIEEECVTLCSNCHRLIHAKYFNSNVDEILEKPFVKTAKSTYSIIIKNIKNFRFIQTDILNPLKKKIIYGEIWKEYLIMIYDFYLKKKLSEFNSLELVNQFNISLSMINRILSQLKIKGLIKIQSEKKPLREGNLIVGQIPRMYKFTDKGKKMAKKLISEI